MNCETYEQPYSKLSGLEVPAGVFFALMASIGFWVTLGYAFDATMSLTQQWSTIKALHEITTKGVYGETYLHVGKDVYSIKKVQQ